MAVAGSNVAAGRLVSWTCSPSRKPCGPGKTMVSRLASTWLKAEPSWIVPPATTRTLYSRPLASPAGGAGAGKGFQGGGHRGVGLRGAPVPGEGSAVGLGLRVGLGRRHGLDEDV